MTEAALRSEEKCRLLLEANPDAYLILDRDLNILSVNRDNFICSRVSEVEFVKSSSHAFIEEDFDGFVSFANKALATKRPQVSHIRKLVDRHCQIQMHPICDSEGGVDLLFCRAIDITEMTLLREKLKSIQEQADAACSAKNAFLANMSHEIRAPLAAMLGFANILTEEDLSCEDRKVAIHAIKTNGEHLTNLVNQILDLSKIEAGRLDVELMTFQLRDIIDYVEAFGTLRTRDKGIAMRVTVDESAPQAITTDPTRLRQILLNVVGNAIKFTERGEVHLHVSGVAGCRSQVQFIVTDTGVGLTPSEQNRIFNPFMQSDASTLRKFGGTGLGLALSRKLARALGGDVLISNTQPGLGSQFVITIEDMMATVPRERSPSPQSGMSFEARLFRKLEILLVDDSQDNLKLVQHMLKSTSAQVTTAQDGIDGVTKALHKNFDLVLMDIQMPHMDGHEAVRALRLGGFKNPVIALTADALKEDRERALREGFDDHLTKPIAKEALVQTIARYASQIGKLETSLH